MKRVLLSFVCMALACFMGNAATATWDADSYGSSNGWVAGTTAVGKTSIAVGNDISFSITSYATAPKYYSGAIRIYKGSTIEFIGGTGVTLTKLVLTGESASYTGEPASVSSGTIIKDGKTLTWNGSANTLTITCSETAQLRLSKIDATYTVSSTGGDNGGDSDKYPALYLRGEFNDWAATNAWKFSTTDGVTYTLKGVSIPAVSEFKVADANWSQANYGGVTAISLGNYYTLGWDSGNCTLDCNVTNATVNFYTDTKSIIVNGTTASKPTTITTPTQGWPSGYEGVMLQGFYWDSYTDTAWPYLESQVNTLSKYFKLIWVPQSARAAADPSMGYDPVYWFTNYNSAFGNEASLRSMIKTYKAKGTGFIADVVINHRSGTTNWTDFPAETWNGVTYRLDHAHICADDEVAWASGQPTPGGNYDTGDGFEGSRDLDHTNAKVQANCKAYCRFLLEDMGYAGFRYDMVKGYSGYYNKLYNEYSNPTYSVGEYFSNSFDEVKGWIEATGRKSAAFDFPFKFAVNEAFGSGDMRKLVWNANGNNQQPAGLIHNGYGQYSVTFVDNHDTYRDGSRFNGNIVAANAFMLCSPGTPCVFLPHWQQYTAEIARMIAIRNAVGISNTSSVNVLSSSRDCYMAEVFGSKGSLVVKIGSAMTSPWGYSDADIRASGYDYCIWSKTEVPDAEYKPEYPKKLYLIGNVNGNGWATASPVAASSSSNGVFTWNKVTINAAGSLTYGNFSFVTTAGANWDIVNQSHRYGAYSSDEEVNGTAGIKIYPGKVTASGALSWKTEAGTYKIVADLSTMTLTLTPLEAGPANSVKTYFVAPDYTGVDGVKLYNSDGGSAGSSSVNMLNQTYTATAADNTPLVTMTYTTGGSTKMAAYGALVRWYKGNIISLTPASGKAITKVEVAYSGSSYSGPFTANNGVVTATANPIVWTGNSSGELRLTASGQIRYSYIAVTVADADSSAPSVTPTNVYVPVTSASDLVVGDQYLLVAPSASLAMGDALSGSTKGYINTVGVEFEADGAIVEAPAGAMVITLEQGTTLGYYSLRYKADGTNFYLAVPSSSTSMSRTTAKSTSNNVQISVGTSNTTLTYVKNKRRLNYGTANGGCFQAYASSSSSKVRLYHLCSSADRVQIDNSKVEVSFIAPVNDVDEGVVLTNSDDSTMAQGHGPNDATLLNKVFVAEDRSGNVVATLKLSEASRNYSGVYDDHIRWYKGNVFTVTPAQGYELVGIDVDFQKGYAGPFSVVEGIGAVEEVEGVLEWTGSTTSAINLVADEQIRFTAMNLVLMKVGESAAEGDGVYKAYLKNDAQWETPYAYAWSDTPLVEWPGTPMEYDEESGLWVYSVESDVAPRFIIFNDGVNNSGNQTEDLDFINGETYSNGYDEDLTAVYLVGVINHWSFQEAYKFKTVDGVNYSIFVSHLDAESDFKIASRQYSPVNLGGVAGIVRDTWYELVPDTMDNCNLAEAMDNFVINVNLDENRVCFSNLVGDVDGSGEVNVSDITALIELVISGDEYVKVADVNGDGEINVSDVTAIISILLGE